MVLSVRIIMCDICDLFHSFGSFVQLVSIAVCLCEPKKSICFLTTGLLRRKHSKL